MWTVKDGKMVFDHTKVKHQRFALGEPLARDAVGQFSLAANRIQEGSNVLDKTE